MVQMRKGKRYRFHAQTTWRQEAKEEETSQLDMMKRTFAMMSGRGQRTWDHYHLHARIQDEKQTNRQLSERKEKEEVGQVGNQRMVSRDRFWEEDDGERQ